MTATYPLPYRQELDGLRAIAVLAVLGYHAGYNDFSGGFMGVDVFFVLSGYLIIQQVRTSLSTGSFNLGAFLVRRLRRLLPAMLPVLVLSTLSALLLKGEGAFEAFTAHFLSAGLFFSNYQFLSEADYFARASDTNLLLHTWSLSLELQFYVVTPFILIAARKLPAQAAAVLLMVLALASLALAEVLISSDNSQWAFFGVLPRYWEFAAGGVIALLSRPFKKLPYSGLVLRSIGMFLVLWAMFGATPGSFPGIGAGRAVLGSMLILMAPTDRPDPVRWVLELRWLRWVGLRSYAIYLVHWPLFVSVTPTSMNRSEGALSAALIASLILGHLIYRYVELPVRTGPMMKPLRAMRRGAVGWAVGVVGLWALLGSPAVTTLSRVLPFAGPRAALTELDNARDSYLDRIDRLNHGTLATDHVRICSFDTISSLAPMLDCLSELTPAAVLVIGDSHGRDTLLALREAYPETDFVMLHNSNCVPAQYPDCFAYLPELIDTLEERALVDRVILSARWGYGEHRFVVDTLERLENARARVLVVGPGPTFSLHIEQYLLAAALRAEDLRDSGVLPLDALAFDAFSANRELAQIAADFGADYFDRLSVYCNDAACRVTTRDGFFAFQDNEHLSPAGITEFSREIWLQPVVSALLCANGASDCGRGGQ